MKFCKHCGGEISANAKFCKHCGQDLSGESTNNSEDQTDKVEEFVEKVNHQNDKKLDPLIESEQSDDIGFDNNPVQSKNPVQGGLAASKKSGHGQPSKLSKKSKIMMTIAGALIVLLFAAYQVGASMTSKDKIIEKFEEAMIKKDSKTVADLLAASKKIEINNNTVTGFINYYSENPSEMDYMMEHLKNQAKEYETNPKAAEAAGESTYSYAVNLVKDGKTFVYDNFDIQVSPVYFNVYTNYNDTEISLNGEVIATSDKEDFTKEVGPFLPGTYTFTATYKNDYVELTAEEESTNFDPGYTDDVDLFIDGEEVTFGLPYNDGLDSVKLFINGNDSGIDILKQDAVGPILADGSMTASFEADFPWGTMKTEEVPIDSYYVEAKFTASDEVKQAIQDTIVQYNKELLAAITTADEKKFTIATEEVVTDIIDDAKYDKENEYYYKGKFIGVDFNSESFVISNYGEGWVAGVDTKTYYEEDSWYGDEEPKLEEATDDVGYELIYDEKQEKWKVNYVGWGGSMDDAEIIEYREKEPKEVTSAWFK
ncbi:zinc ribbon domain-containing protein [Virgibacillus oceani]|uniref:Membrane protein YvbJ n=1 Tax=Virgibacillus oceani TaxID=1479511 RepID=A0A917LYT1_9BACI|nr:zinc-ribbon domain-containing protein [Virgibacillus oceani]GGG67741.1 putative membrane protein YvbJ [Virgibacillus oceani]